LIALFVTKSRYGPPDDPPFIFTQNALQQINGTVTYKETKQQYGQTICTFYLSNATIKIDEPLGTSQSNYNHTNTHAFESTLGKTIHENDSNVPSASAETAQLIRLGSILCETNSQPPPMGAKVTLWGKYDSFSIARNPGEFDQASYYQSLGISYQFKDCQITQIHNPRIPIREMLYQLKEAAKNRLFKALPEKEASVLAAMLLGDKTNLDQDLKDLYTRSGIIHILSISGLHISLLGIGFYQLLRKLGVPIKPAAVIGTVVLFLYGLLTGMPTSAIRAIGMYTLRMLSHCVGRTYDMLNAMGILAFLMLLWQPGYMDHAGFLLSFSSVAGIGFLSPLLTRQQKDSPSPIREVGAILTRRTLREMKHQTKKGKVKEAYALRKAVKLRALLCECGRDLSRVIEDNFRIGLSVTLTTLPVVLWFYYRVAISGLFINLWIIPTTGILMISGILLLLCPWIPLFSWVIIAIVQFYEMLCNLFNRLPFHNWIAGKPRLWQVVLYYAILIGLLLYKSLHEKFALREKHCICSKKRSHKSQRLERIKQSPKERCSSDVKYNQKENSANSLKHPRDTSHINDLKPIRNISYTNGQKSARHISLSQRFLTKFIVPAGLIVAVLLFRIPKPKEIQIDFLDVGQGDGICIQDEDTVYLIDGGSSSKRGLGEYTLLPYLLSEGITEVDAIFLTHGDTDHYSGIAELLSMAANEGITIKMLVLPALDPSILAAEFAEIYEAASNYPKPLTIATMSAGTTWQTENLTFRCLHPSLTLTDTKNNAYANMNNNAQSIEGGNSGTYAHANVSSNTSSNITGILQPYTSPSTQVKLDSNAQSLCLFVENDDFGMLLTGDVEGSGETALLRELQARGIHDITVLKVAHHGSASSTDSDFLKQLRPQIAIISCGVDNSYGHPHPDLLSRLEAVDTTTFTTAQVGSIRLRLSDARLRVETFLHTR
jgi:competence protein ComEC